MYEELKATVCALNKALITKRLVTMTSGNVSGRDFANNVVAIKPSGVSFEDLRSEDIVIVALDGNVVDGKLKPSVDTATHLYIYRNMPEVGGVIHTHSNYATAFAACGKPIPVYLTAIADEFGAPIPVSEYAQIGEEEIGAEVVRIAKTTTSPAILMKNHGVFAIGPNPQAAFKAAVMVEDVAKTTAIALQLGSPVEIPKDEVERGYRRYQQRYGQK